MIVLAGKVPTGNGDGLQLSLRQMQLIHNELPHLNAQNEDKVEWTSSPS